MSGRTINLCGNIIVDFYKNACVLLLKMTFSKKKTEHHVCIIYIAISLFKTEYNVYSEYFNTFSNVNLIKDTSVGQEKADFSALYDLLLLVSDPRGFLFLLVLQIGCITIYRFILDLPYDYLPLSISML